MPFNDTLSEKDFRRIAEYVEAETGIHLSLHKQDMVQMRVAKRVQALGLSGFAEYVDHVFNTGVGTFELPRLIDAVTTNKTEFFRESDHFDALADTVLPELLSRREYTASRPLRVWCAACSTGEEPYTVAMVLRDAMLLRRFEFEICASDICGEALVKAQRAVYPEEAIIPVPEEMRHRYLLRSKDNKKRVVRIGSEIRSHVRFVRSNLLNDPPPYGQADIVFCRNVLIYFQHHTQRKVLEEICTVAQGGYLFVGHSESLHSFNLPLTRVTASAYKVT